MYYTLYTHMVQIDTVSDWGSMFSIIGVILALLMAGYSVYKSSKKENSDTFARKDMVNKDFELMNNRIDDHEELNRLEFGYLKEYLEELRATNESMNSKIDILINRD